MALTNLEKLTTDGQVEVIQAARKFFGPKKTVVTRSELVKFVKEVYNYKWAPGFLVRNVAFKLKDKEGNIVRGKYKLPPVSSKPLSKSPDAVAKRQARRKGPKTATVATVSVGVEETSKPASKKSSKKAPVTLTITTAESEPLSNVIEIPVQENTETI